MAKFQLHGRYNNNNNNNNSQQGKPYNRNNNNDRSFNRQGGGYNNKQQQHQKHRLEPQHHRQQQQHQRHNHGKKNRVVKEVPINHSIKGPLFDKSRLYPSWKFKRSVGPGFINGHNTCFLNSVLQCLTYTPPLAQYLLKGEHTNNCRSDGYCALCAMEIHIMRCFKDPKSFIKNAAILPSYFTSNLRTISKTLRLGRQEDAHEFYILLLSAFQKGSIAGLGKLPPKVEETTLIHQVFGGKLRSQLKCYNCNATSNNYEACLDLSVDLNNNANTLEDTLNNFIKVDQIDGYKCDACKQTVKAGKQMTVNEAPLMLTVHLKRFAFDLYTGSMRKISKHVEFSETLDLAPCMSKDKSETNTSYSLYAVLVHYGYGCSSGHYYAFVKNTNGLWYCMDDESVQPTTLNEVLKENAYMLFYQQNVASLSTSDKIPPPVPSSPPVVKELDIQPPPVVMPKKAIKDTTQVKKTPKDKKKKKQLEEPKDTRRVVIERVMADSPDAWYTQSADKPHRSLRGNMSPPTYGAAVSDATSWTINDLHDYVSKVKSKKRRVFRKNLEARKSDWTVQPY
ncbi:hypothetical protein INT47_010777 [Mucor saturninus]|uniref:ubiquitinyl hydrolase 1 n=1 Tax=Mucor saturninus TaxID=64648 RepID=A0A8H7UW82_9FUNG|nr:hypothetical protein INT47_010777 [Mucor saturninus]